jgi:hypothetical protein
MRQYDLPNYDNWLNSNNPYDREYEIEEEREYHLENISVLKTEEDIEEYLFYHKIEDPRED